MFNNAVVVHLIFSEDYRATHWVIKYAFVLFLDIFVDWTANGLCWIPVAKVKFFWPDNFQDGWDVYSTTVDLSRKTDGYLSRPHHSKGDMVIHIIIPLYKWGTEKFSL